MAEFTDDHLGKRVVAQKGTEVGTVSDVRDGSLYVEVGPDADPETLDDLGWKGVVAQEVHRLKDRYVSNITDDVVRLRV